MFSVRKIIINIYIYIHTHILWENNPCSHSKNPTRELLWIKHCFLTFLSSSGNSPERPSDSIKDITSIHHLKWKSIERETDRKRVLMYYSLLSCETGKDLLLSGPTHLLTMGWKCVYICEEISTEQLLFESRGQTLLHQACSIMTCEVNTLVSYSH